MRRILSPLLNRFNSETVSRDPAPTVMSQLRQLVLFLPDLLAITLTRQRFLHSLLLTRFQIKRVPLNFLDDVLGLHFALETAQGILERLTFLNTNFCQDEIHLQTCQNGFTS
jgi:hypothetical protein